MPITPRGLSQSYFTCLAAVSEDAPCRPIFPSYLIVLETAILSCPFGSAEILMPCRGQQQAIVLYRVVVMMPRDQPGVPTE